MSRSRVRFEEIEPSCREDQHEISDEEIQAYWYCTSDYARFQRDRCSSHRALKSAHGDASRVDSSKWCFRGMEEMLNDGYATKVSRIRLNLRKAVLEEQDRQRHYGVFDPIGLMKASTAVSEWARQHALELGRHDAREAATGEEEPIPFALSKKRQDKMLPSNKSSKADDEVLHTPSLNHLTSRNFAAMSA